MICAKSLYEDALVNKLELLLFPTVLNKIINDL